LRTPVCSYPIIVTHLSFNFLCLLLLYSIYLNDVYAASIFVHHRKRRFCTFISKLLTETSNNFEHGISDVRKLLKEDREDHFGDISPEIAFLTCIFSLGINSSLTQVFVWFSASFFCSTKCYS
jgi:hypothetical protein